LQKNQWIEKTRGSEVLAVLGAVLEKVEILSDYLEKEPAEIEMEEWILDVDIVLNRIAEGLLDLRVRAPQEILEKAGIAETRLELSGRSVLLRLIGDPELWGVPASSLYDKLPRAILRMDGHIFKQLAFETSRNGIEYMGIYVREGVVAFFEGEHYRVSLPFVRSLASIHTHPEGACSLSLPDIRSGLDLLVEGGFFEAAVTPSCAAVMYRIGLVSEDDYIALKEYLLRAGKARRPQKPPRLDTIVFAMLAY